MTYPNPVVYRRAERSSGNSVYLVELKIAQSAYQTEGSCSNYRAQASENDREGEQHDENEFCCALRKCCLWHLRCFALTPSVSSVFRWLKAH
ncbi:MAG TPA: hypothetical protein VL134_13075 [Leptolyngbya sp.]|nr:hypothetical protein [Leptolyngbya sp.]